MAASRFNQANPASQAALLAAIVTCLALGAILIAVRQSGSARSPGKLSASVAGLGLAIAGASFARKSIREVKLLASALEGASRSTRAAQSALESTYFEFVEVMARALDARDPYTAGHSIRVGAYAHSIALEMGLPADQADTIRIAAELHDIGKIGIPDVILQKPGQLDPDENGLVMLHPQVGRKILERVKLFEKLLPVVELHHENYDGSGYPYGLTFEATPIGARIVHVADAFDAMTTDRSYRNARPVDWALEELLRCSGTQFDPEVVAAFLARIRKQGLDEMVLSSGPMGAPAPVLAPGLLVLSN